MEVSENNNNIRTASFHILLNLFSLEQIVYAAYYDNDMKAGNPRKGRITVGLIGAFAVLTNDEVKNKAKTLYNVWSAHWQEMPTNQLSVDKIVEAIDSVRYEIKLALSSLA
ncbi:hypothetical protein [Colwellia sp. TT2012]|uniref:hypothetical protein n=1 Tax=Colwellia sp. TT2012 TaxID=1720342 RepID=UPI000AAD76D5|nr:hypothetical protein [Colwellia sp. TT2012]